MGLRQRKPEPPGSGAGAGDWLTPGRFAFLLLVWLDLVSHVPRQNSTVPPALLKPGWVREEMAQAPPPELGQGRVALHVNLERDFGRLVFPDLVQQYTVGRRTELRG